MIVRTISFHHQCRRVSVPQLRGLKEGVRTDVAVTVAIYNSLAILTFIL